MRPTVYEVVNVDLDGHFDIAVGDATTQSCRLLFRQSFVSLGSLTVYSIRPRGQPLGKRSLKRMTFTRT